MPGEPLDRPGGEGHRAVLTFIRQHLGVGQRRGIIDGDMDIFPAVPTLIAPAGDTMADAIDPVELLDIDMDEFARRLSLVAEDGGLGIECTEAA